MNYLTIDIETIALEKDLPQEDKDKLQELDEVEKQEFLNCLPLSPFTSKIGCIGIKNCNESEHYKGYCLINSNIEFKPKFPELYKYVFFGNEIDLLTKFWHYLKMQKNYKFVTFNGREFDFPYLMIRSAYLGVACLVDIMRGSDWTMDSYHIDIAKKLTFNKFAKQGPLQKHKLDYYTKRFNNSTSKIDEVQGPLVGILWNQGKIKEVADYNCDDLEETFKLFLTLNKLNIC